MPAHILCDEPRFLVVLELISGDVNDHAVVFKPRMGVFARAAHYVLHVLMSLLVKVLAKQERCVATSPTGEVLHSYGKVRRFYLHNRGAKGEESLLYVLAIIADAHTGRLFVNHGYALSLGDGWFREDKREMKKVKRD